MSTNDVQRMSDALLQRFDPALCLAQARHFHVRQEVAQRLAISRRILG